MLKTPENKKDLSVQFLQEKIHELQTALFFSVSNSVLQLPVHVITAERVDEEGQIWFAIPAPGQFARELESEFPAKLDFFRKGTDFFLKVEGKASIIVDLEKISSECPFAEKMVKKFRGKKILIIKLLIQRAHYFEVSEKAAQKPAVIRNQKAQIFTWLLPMRNEPMQPQLALIPIELIRNERPSY